MTATFVEASVAYPRCIGGARRRPPEHCGGAGDFEEFLAAIGNKRHPKHKEYVERIGGSFEPDAIDPRRVHFDNPARRLRMAIEE